MPIRDRIEALERAKVATLSGDYGESLRIVDLVLRNEPKNTEALCLKGNTLELMVFAEQLDVPLVGSVEIDSRLLAARECYEMALAIDPVNGRAMRDLADHLKDVGQTIAALNLYDQLVNLLRGRVAIGEQVDDDLKDAEAERDELL